MYNFKDIDRIERFTRGVEAMQQQAFAPSLHRNTSPGIEWFFVSNDVDNVIFEGVYTADLNHDNTDGDAIDWAALFGISDKTPSGVLYEISATGKYPLIIAYDYQNSSAWYLNDNSIRETVLYYSVDFLTAGEHDGHLHPDDETGAHTHASGPYAHRPDYAKTQQFKTTRLITAPGGYYLQTADVAGAIRSKMTVKVLGAFF